MSSVVMSVWWPVTLLAVSVFCLWGRLPVCRSSHSGRLISLRPGSLPSLTGTLNSSTLVTRQHWMHTHPLKCTVYPSQPCKPCLTASMSVCDVCMLTLAQTMSGLCIYIILICGSCFGSVTWHIHPVLYLPLQMVDLVFVVCMLVRVVILMECTRWG